MSRDGKLLRRYAYDAFGNRTLKEDYSGQSPEQTTYRYNANNQLVSMLDTEGEQTYAYDRRGNLTAVSRGDELLKAFTFGAANRMDSALRIKEGIEKRAEYHYDAFGNRRGQDIYSRQVNGGIPDMGVEKPQDPEQRIRYTLDITRPYHNLLVSEDNVRQKNQSFYWDGNVAAMEDAGQDSYYLQDDLGSPMQLLDENGEIRESYGFDEFGQSLYDGAEQQLQPFGFTGYQMETAGGLYFAQARRYDAGAGRFVSEDKIAGNIERPFALNRYSYCWNNPMDFMDLNGLDPFTTAEGREAHRKLQAYLEINYPGVAIEVPIPDSSENGNTGFADIVYTQGTTVEIYEIKPISYYYPDFTSNIDYRMIKETPINWYKGNALNPNDKRIPNNISGKAQLQRYIQNYYKKFDIFEGEVKAGTSLNPEINEIMLPSEIHDDLMIKYYTYPTDPGMIYWGYVKKPEDEKQPVESTVPATQIEVNEIIEGVGVATFATAIVWLGYEGIKWGIAALLAPETMGGSLAVAGCIP